MKMQDPETKYVAVMLDANGDILPDGGVANGNAGTYAIQDRDISTVYIYLCDYYEYMDELKGYYWSDDYEEKQRPRPSNSSWMSGQLPIQKYILIQINNDIKLLFALDIR